MKRTPSSMLSFLSIVTGIAIGVAPLRAADEPLVHLDAASLSEGPLTAWPNAGTLGGTFRDDGTLPQVKVVDGVKAVDFGGKDRMVADFVAPETLAGDRPWTCVVRIWARDVSRERTMVSWANRPDNCIEIEYGDAVLWGALGTWSPFTTGWGDAVPEARRWHTLIHTYRGGKDGEFQAWCDGFLRVRKSFSLATKPGRPFVIGACMAGLDIRPRDPDVEAPLAWLTPWVLGEDGAIHQVPAGQLTQTRFQIRYASRVSIRLQIEYLRADRQC